MKEKSTRDKQARLIRRFRKIHRSAGALFFVFFFFIAITGLLLGWKKNSGDILIPKSYAGTSTNLEDWLPIDSLHKTACLILHDSVSSDLSLELDRIDIRKDKGMVKFIFTDHYWEVQLDGATGKLLHIGRRHSDLIENIHEGSVLDDFFGMDGAPFKLIYTTITGVALLVFTITGFWLWFGPKRLRVQARKQRASGTGYVEEKKERRA